jgi:hypothetical protein
MHEEKKMGHTPIHPEEKRKIRWVTLPSTVKRREKENHHVWAEKYGPLLLIYLSIGLLATCSEKKEAIIISSACQKKRATV